MNFFFLEFNLNKILTDFILHINFLLRKNLELFEIYFEVLIRLNRYLQFFLLQKK